MGKKRRVFIDKKEAVTFHLVHRSQHDPLITDETAPQHVLVETQPSTSKVDPAKRLEEQKKYGVFFDDNYDYLQHLKQPGKDVVWEYVEVPNQRKGKRKGDPIQLPSSLFATEFEEEEGMLNKAAPRPGPRPDWDPDVVAALDDDFNYEDPDNALEDDFFSKAMGDGIEESEDDEEDEDGSDEDFDSDAAMFSDEEDEKEFNDRLAPLMRERRFDDEETKSRFTEYSLSSSVIRRNEQLSLLDDRFEKFFTSYDDTEVGPLDMEEIEGHIDEKNPALMQCYKEFKRSDKCDNMLKYDKNWDSERIKRLETEDETTDDIEEVEVEKDKHKKWDCESILSTYTNIYNHPKLIEEPKRKTLKIQIDPKTGLPMHTLRGADSDKLTTKSLAKFNTENDIIGNNSDGPKSLCSKSVVSALSVLSIRPKDETHEEKLERKRLLKEYRSERRIEKKFNKEAFKDEKKRQEKIQINNRNNFQGAQIV